MFLHHNIKAVVVALKKSHNMPGENRKLFRHNDSIEEITPDKLPILEIIT